MSDTIQLSINGKDVQVAAGSTVLQACEAAHTEIPVFCYHPKLSIAGNCRMCLVEMEGSKKPIASCAMPASNGMVIHTHSDMVKKARQGVLELLLINHPLDCPICDQGGECDLQDITVSYGCGDHRFDLNKRAVSDKHMGPLIKTHMTRCIHCTRCVRFAHEVAGTSELGTLNRGEHMEITTLLDSAITSELSGNLIDICPVGALTNKPYAYHGRPWELSHTYSIDVMDGVGSHIRIDTLQSLNVMRILPRACDEMNEDWISDKTRFAYDGLTYQRLHNPYKRGAHGFEPLSWEDALNAAADLLTSCAPHEIAAITGDVADVESVFSLKRLMHSMGVEHLESRWSGVRVYPKTRTDYLMNSTIAGIDEVDVCLLIGVNPRFEASTLNARLKKRSWSGDLHIALVGEAVDLTYTYEHLGTCPRDLSFLDDTSHPMTQALQNAHRPMIVVGEGSLAHHEGAALWAYIQRISHTLGIIRPDWFGLNVLARHAGTVGALDLGFLPKNDQRTMEDLYIDVEAGRIKVIYALNADGLDVKRLSKAQILYQGHHADAGALHSQLALAGLAYSEKRATYVNTEGRIQHTLPACKAPGTAKEDWRIIRALSQTLHDRNHTIPVLPFDDAEQLYHALKSEYPIFQSDGMMRPDISTIQAPAPTHAPTSPAPTSKEPFLGYSVSDFYTDHVIARHSKIMAECLYAHTQPHEPQKSSNTHKGKA